MHIIAGKTAIAKMKIANIKLQLRTSLHTLFCTLHLEFFNLHYIYFSTYMSRYEWAYMLLPMIISTVLTVSIMSLSRGSMIAAESPS